MFMRPKSDWRNILNFNIVELSIDTNKLNCKYGGTMWKEQYVDDFNALKQIFTISSDDFFPSFSSCTHLRLVWKDQEHINFSSK